MLRYRVLAALVLIPLVVWSVLSLPSRLFAAALGAFWLLAAWEWTRLLGWQRALVRGAFLGLVAACLGWLFLQLEDASFSRMLYLLAAAWWGLAFAWLFRPQWGRGRTLPKMVAAFCVLLPAWFALSQLHMRPEDGPWLVLYVLALMWVADSGAYFAGRAFGRHKLAPAVSPGKTWEGVAGGLLGVMLYAWGSGQWFGWQGGELAGFVVLALFCASMSVVGDLFISLLKRQQGLKDTGHLIPGHGGLLDRVDSLLAAAPLFTLGLGLLRL